MFSEFPLFVFTSCAGAAAGLYAGFALFDDKFDDMKKPWLIQLACFVLLAIGLVGCIAHVRKPELFMMALSNPQAGIAQEAYLSIIFGCIVFVDFVMSLMKKSISKALRVIGAVVGFALTCIMGTAYFNSLGVAAWTTWATLPIFFAGAMAMGLSLLPILDRNSAKSLLLLITTGAAGTITFVSVIALAIHFNDLGLGVEALVAAAALSALGAIIEFAACAKKLKWAPAAVCICFTAGVLIARYAFYAAYAI